MKYRRKKIWMNYKKTRYIWCYLWKDKEEMNEEYHRRKPSEKPAVLGTHMGRVAWYYEKKKRRLYPQSGIIFLHIDNCGATVAAHEFMHGAIWAHRHSLKKKQYPFTIKSMNEEEELLHNFSYAIGQFYDWYWDVKDNKLLK